MKTKHILSSLLTLGLLAGLTTTAFAKDKDEAKLAAEAKISKADAEKAALAKVPGGTVKDAELEEEGGKLIWSVDISIPDSKDIKEVPVDALTGEVGKIETETPADQAKEAAEDAAKEKKEKKEKDDDEKEQKGEHKDKADKDDKK